MLGAVEHYWTRFNGWAVAQGVDLLDLPLDALLDLIYHWLTKDAQEEDVERLDSKLWLPPKKALKREIKDSPWSDEAAKASLAAFAGAAEAVT